MKWLLVWIGLFAQPISLFTYVYMFTDMGDVFRTGNGSDYQLISNYGGRDGRSFVFKEDNEGYLLTSKGDILKTVDGCKNWQPVASISVKDAVKIIYTGSKFIVLTESGDVYRGSFVNSLSLIGNIGSSDFVSIMYDGTFLYALCENGDIWRSSDEGSSWETVGTTGSIKMVAITSKLGMIYAINNTGDFFESSDYGLTWHIVSTVSQTGIIDLFPTSDHKILASLKTGTLMEETSGQWQYLGTASQVGVVCLSANTVALKVDGDSGIANPVFKLRTTVIKEFLGIESPEGIFRIFNLKGDMVMKIIKKDGYKEINVNKLKSGRYFISGFGITYKFLKSY